LQLYRETESAVYLAVEELEEVERDAVEAVVDGPDGGKSEKVVIIKSVSNWISYIHEFYQNFPHLVSIFLVRKSDL
jgi:hypothetical protein